MDKLGKRDWVEFGKVLVQHGGSGVGLVSDGGGYGLGDGGVEVKFGYSWRWSGLGF